MLSTGVPSLSTSLKASLTFDWSSLGARGATLSPVFNSPLLLKIVLLSMFASRLVPSVASVTTIVFPVDLTLFLVAVASSLAISATVAALNDSVAALNVLTMPLIDCSANVALPVSAWIPLSRRTVALSIDVAVVI